MLPEVKTLIDHYNLQPLPVEGTLFASTYRSTQNLDNGRPLATAMVGLYCEDPHSVSLFHKLAVDEIWHFYGGDPLRVILLYPDASSKDVIMGSDPLKGQRVQLVIPAGVWQAGHLIGGGRYSLYGCTMAPGFNPELFTAGLCEELLARYPDRAKDIIRFCCRDGETKMPAGFAS